MKVQNTILLGTSLVFVIAFSSFYFQFPGICGRQGILPIQWLNFSISNEETAKHANLLLKLSNAISIDTDIICEIASLIGLLISMGAVALKHFRNPLSFLVMYACYLLCVLGGQAFMNYQWNWLLLETSILTVLLAIANNKNDSLPVLFLFRWLAFRSTFSMAATRLLSKNPSWWSLQGSTGHLLTQFLPTMLARYVYNLKYKLFQKMIDAVSYLCTLGFVWPLILPFDRLRTTAFYILACCQLSMFVIGNHGFVSFLKIVLATSALVDDHNFKGTEERTRTSVLKTITNICSYIVLPIAFTSFVLVRYFGLNISTHANGYAVDLAISFSYANFAIFVDWATTFACGIAFITLIAYMLSSFNRSLAESRSSARTIWIFYRSIVYSLVYIGLFLSSVNNLKDVSPTLTKIIPRWPLLTKLMAFDQLHLTSTYDDFDGVVNADNRRFELIIEGTMDYNQWIPYEFIYLPQNQSRAPLQAAPFTPLLDYQMWKAVKSVPETESWYLNFIYRLLQNSKDVTSLLGSNPFCSGPPKAIRTSVYSFNFTEPGSKEWWVNEYIKPWHIPLTLNDSVFENVQLAENLNVDYESSKNRKIRHALNFIRRPLSNLSGFNFCMSLTILPLVTAHLVHRLGPF